MSEGLPEVWEPFLFECENTIGSLDHHHWLIVCHYNAKVAEFSEQQQNLLPSFDSFTSMKYVVFPALTKVE